MYEEVGLYESHQNVLVVMDSQSIQFSHRLTIEIRPARWRVSRIVVACLERAYFEKDAEKASDFDSNFASLLVVIDFQSSRSSHRFPIEIRPVGWQNVQARGRVP